MSVIRTQHILHRKRDMVPPGHVAERQHYSTNFFAYVNRQLTSDLVYNGDHFTCLRNVTKLRLKLLKLTVADGDAYGIVVGLCLKGTDDPRHNDRFNLVYSHIGDYDEHMLYRQEHQHDNNEDNLKKIFKVICQSSSIPSGIVIYNAGDDWDVVFPAATSLPDLTLRIELDAADIDNDCVIILEMEQQI